MKTVLQKLSRFEAAKLAFFLSVVFGVILIFTLTPSLFPSALISCILFFVFAPLIGMVERKGISRTTGIVGVFLICGLMITTAAQWITPRISQEIEAFEQGSSRYNADIAQKLKEQEKKILGSYPLLKEAQLTEKLLAWTQRSADRLWSIAANLASSLFLCFFLVPFLTFILLKDAPEIRRSVLKLVPNRYFETIYGLIARILNEMGDYVSARIIEALLVSLLVGIGCFIFKLPYTTLLAVFAGATNAIPYLGPLFGAAPGILIAILEPTVPNQLFLMALVYVTANLIDTLLIFPLVVAKIVDLHPVAVVLSVILGSQLFGIVGMIVAVPLTSILKILVQELYARIYVHHKQLR